MSNLFSTGLQVAGGLFAIAAAVYWFLAKFPTPPHIVGMFPVEQGAANAGQAAFKEAWGHANTMNSIAARLTGIAALLQGVGAILSGLGY